MKVKRVDISNYRGVENVTIEPHKRNLYIGKNGSGKTSILDAIRFGITGDSSSNPIRFGYDSAEVVIVNGDVIRRVASAKGNKVWANGHVTTIKSINELIQSKTGVDPGTIKVITSAPIMKAMNSGELSDFLTSSGLLPLEVDTDTIISWCSLSPDAAVMARMYMPAMPERYGLDVINSVYNDFYAERAALAREIKVQAAKAKYDGEPPARTIAAVDKELERLNDSKSEIAIYKAALNAYEQADMKRRSQLKEIESLEKKLDALGKVVVPDENMRRNAERQIEDINSQMNKAHGVMSVLMQVIHSLEMSLANLESSKCPLSDKLTCTTDKTEVREEIEESVAASKAEMENQRSLIKTLEEKKKMFQDQITKYNAVKEQYQKAVALNDRIKALKGALIPLPRKPEEPKTAKEDETRIDALKKEHAEITAYNLAMEAAKAKEEKETRLEIVQELVNALNPKGGIREKILSTAIAPMVDYINVRSDEMKVGIKVSIEASNGTKIYCQTKNSGGFIPLEDASMGQQAMIMYLIMDLLNSLSGLGILFLDGLETMDADAFDALLNALESTEAESAYDHIFVACVDHEDLKSIASRHSSKWLITNL